MVEPSYYLPIGGLVAVGFDPTEKYLLAISHNGRGVFSTKTWERIARNPELAYPENGIGIGIGPISGARIPVVEMYWDDESERKVESLSGRIQRVRSIQSHAFMRHLHVEYYKSAREFGVTLESERRTSHPERRSMCGSRARRAVRE